MQIVIRSNRNLSLIESLCQSTSDREVALFLKYGWPIDRDESPVVQTYTNHKSAIRYPQQINQYILKELRFGTLMAPFVTSPFDLNITGVSPLSTRPKRNSQKHRIIVDLSWPQTGGLVNSGILKTTYLGNTITLRYPTVNDLCKRASQLWEQSDQPIFGWKKDAEHAFKQIPLDPGLWPALGMYWGGLVF